ncbi:protein TIC 20-v, chloroplastic isoform X2 [Cryptomeria japonica]|uniref:protein TIC 20-v, chloroplastic isoform X2 n=1 Tax=Cryptomeria japonica TaxID=3369 RepID=UPI0027DA8D9E|nr:protein TIC 20-v, chloroplastic isoform X2 [Cryptomeria japonica]
MAASLSFTSYFPNQFHTQKIAASFQSTCISPTKFLNVKLNIRCSPRRRFDFSIQEKPRKVICANANNKNSIPIPDRLLAAVGYFLPFFDGVQYGRFFLIDFPSAQLLLQPLSPAIRVYKSYPYASILVLIILYFYVVPNPNIRRYVRFNVMQAVALDVLLTVADIVDHAFEPQNGIGLSLLTSFDTTVFLFLLTCLVYGSTSCLMGQVARLPLVADAAETQARILNLNDAIISLSSSYLNTQFKDVLPASCSYPHRILW